MCSRFEWTLLILLLGLTPKNVSAQAVSAPEQSPAPRVLRVAADPNNLPFSNQRQEGFENKIAELIARELNATLVYTWRAQRRGFFRETLKQGDCDLVLGIPTDSEMALTTQPYYRSSYAFVFPKDKNFTLTSLDDPVLRTLKIGIQLAGDVEGNTPAAHALARRGIVTNVVGFTVYGNYSEANPPAKIFDALEAGKIDVAIVWGPLGGYFARQHDSQFAVVPIIESANREFFSFAISLGVKRKQKAFRDELNSILVRRHSEIQAILNDFGVPQITMNVAETAGLKPNVSASAEREPPK